MTVFILGSTKRTSSDCQDYCEIVSFKILETSHRSRWSCFYLGRGVFFFSPGSLEHFLSWTKCQWEVSHEGKLGLKTPSWMSSSKALLKWEKPPVISVLPRGGRQGKHACHGPERGGLHWPPSGLWSTHYLPVWKTKRCGFKKKLGQSRRKCSWAQSKSLHKELPGGAWWKSRFLSLGSWIN